jgi:hypothetical protein
MSVLSCPYIKFKGQAAERNLIKAILNSPQASSSSKNFPKVSVIGRNKKIHPDIDIFQIKDKDQSSKRLIGLEVKVIKIIEEKRKKKGWNWEEIYKGIGQALLYLQFGLDQCGLILGFHENVPNEKIEEFEEELKKKVSLLAQILGGYFTLGLFLWEKGGIFEIVKADRDFRYSNYGNQLYGKEVEENIKDFRNLLLSRQFLWDKKLAKSCEYAEK